MKLYYSPGSCALGVHILLEEIGAPFELHRINFAEREQQSPEYLAFNPKGKVPALQLDDGPALTEFQAISTYLALTHPEKRLIPSDALSQARMFEAMDYVVGTIHAQGFRRLFRTAEFAPSAADHDTVKARGMEIAKAGFALIDKDLADKPWLAGDFSIADPALFYVSFWAEARLKMGLPSHVLGALPADVCAPLREEGAERRRARRTMTSFRHIAAASVVLLFGVAGARAEQVYTVENWPADIDTIPCSAWSKVGDTWVLNARLKVGGSELDNVGVKGDAVARKLDRLCGKK